MEKEPVTAAAMVAVARSRVESLTPTDVAAALDGETLLVDVREPDELKARGVLFGAVLAPRGVLEFWADPDSSEYREEFQPSRRIILYCDNGARSSLAADTLRRMGYWRAAILDGGLEAWQMEGRTMDMSAGRMSGGGDPT